jgi:hypothetical protein
MLLLNTADDVGLCRLIPCFAYCPAIVVPSLCRENTSASAADRLSSSQGIAWTRNKYGAPLVVGGSVKPVVWPDARIQSVTGDHAVPFVLPRMR